jgi:hypothetical protein
LYTASKSSFALNFGVSAGVTTYNFQNGTYTKVGNLVTVRCYIAINTKSAATGLASLQGFPFPTRAGSAIYQTGSIYMSNQSITGAPMSYFDPNSSYANLGQTNGTSGYVSMFDTNFLNNGDFIFQTSYLTS